MRDNELIGVREHRDRAGLVETYKTSFKARIGIQPIVDINVANDVCGWLMSQVGFDKAQSLIQAYLEMDDPWINEQAFPLEVLKKQINKVMVVLSASEKRRELRAGKNLRISIWTSCKNDRCNRRVMVECDADKVEEAPYSKLCNQCDCLASTIAP